MVKALQALVVLLPCIAAIIVGYFLVDKTKDWGWVFVLAAFLGSYGLAIAKGIYGVVVEEDDDGFIDY